MTKPARVASNGREARGRVLVLGDEAAHRAEAGEDERVDARLGAAGEHDIGVAAPDRSRRPRRPRASRSRTRRRARSWGRAGRARSRSGRSRSRRARSGGRTARLDPGRARGGRRAARRSRAGRRSPSRRRSPTRAGSSPVPRRPSTPPAPRRARAGRSAPSAAPPSRGATVGRIEALDLGRDPDGKLARVEGLDEVDAALAGDRGPPGRGRVETERRDRSQAGDPDATHRAIVVSGRLVANAGTGRHGDSRGTSRPREGDEAEARLLHVRPLRELPPRRGLPRAGAPAPPQPRHVQAPPRRRRRAPGPRAALRGRRAADARRRRGPDGARPGSRSRAAAGRSRLLARWLR